jgi:hypothetical protein
VRTPTGNSARDASAVAGAVLRSALERRRVALETEQPRTATRARLRLGFVLKLMRSTAPLEWTQLAVTLPPPRPSCRALWYIYGPRITGPRKTR